MPAGWGADAWNWLSHEAPYYKTYTEIYVYLTSGVSEMFLVIFAICDCQSIKSRILVLSYVFFTFILEDSPENHR